MKEVEFEFISPGLFDVVHLKGAIWREAACCPTLVDFSAWLGDIQARLYWTEIYSKDLAAIRNILWIENNILVIPDARPLSQVS